jgi:hypothetical protein
MAIERASIDYNNAATESFSTKLYSDEFNALQLEKSVDVKVTELIKPLPTPNLDLVPRQVYQAEVDLNVELNKEITDLNAEMEDLRAKLNQKTSDSGSLYISNDFLKLTNANLENSLESNNNIVSELRTNLSTALQKAISENAERTGLEAENAGLVAQKTALLKQIDTLNNLVSAAQTSVAKTQEAVGNFNQVKSEAGAKVAGNLAAFSPQIEKPAPVGIVKIKRDKSGSSGANNSFSDGGNVIKVAAGGKNVNVTVNEYGAGPNNVWRLQWNQRSINIPAGQIAEFSFPKNWRDSLSNNGWPKSQGGRQFYTFDIIFTVTSEGQPTQTATFKGELANE